MRMARRRAANAPLKRCLAKDEVLTGELPYWLAWRRELKRCLVKDEVLT